MRNRLIWTGLAVALSCAAVMMGTEAVRAQGMSCDVGMPEMSQLRNALREAPSVGGTVGGLFNGERMWAALVNRSGLVCMAVTSTDDPYQVWPGSQAIAKSKAYTANAFSLDGLALSTARLYTFTQPGHSLWSLGQSNVSSPLNLQVPGGGGADINQVTGGLIFFGGGVPIYGDGRLLGGLGVSGDTSCADHEIAKRVRQMLGMNPPGGALVDDIVYTESVFAHPLCINTYQNGTKAGEEKTANYR